MKAHLFLAMLLSPLSFAQSKEALRPLRICYVSMNADTEEPFLSRFVSLFSEEVADRGYSAEVKELLPSGGKPLDAIQKAIDSGVKCDGLVLSGHFCGEFHGSRMRGAYVTLPMIEKLSCLPQNTAWFGNIRALWVQGCRSLGVGNSSFCPAPSQQVEQNLPETPDGYADRALGHADTLVAEGFSADFRNLYSGYSETVGSKNPPGDRYLRIFPSANVYGWTATSPGEGQSEVSIPHHFSQVILKNPQVSESDKQTLFSAKKFYRKEVQEMNATNKKLYADSYIRILTGSAPQDTCRAWNTHVKSRQPGPYNLDRWDFCPSSTPSMAHLSSLDNNQGDTLEKYKAAKELNCKMAVAKTEDDWRDVLESKTFNESIIPLVFPMLWESLSPPVQKGVVIKPATVRPEDLRSSKVFMNYLSARIQDPLMPAVSKIEWYFYLRGVLESPNYLLAKQVASDAQAFIDLGLPNKLPGRATIALEGLHRDLRKKINVLKEAELASIANK